MLDEMLDEMLDTFRLRHFTKPRKTLGNLCNAGEFPMQFGAGDANRTRDSDVGKDAGGAGEVSLAHVTARL